MSKRRSFMVEKLVQSHGSRQPRRAGFTIMELMLVLVIAGIVIAISGHGLSAAYNGNSRQSATRVAATSLFQARAIAIQRARQSWLVRSGNTIKIVGDSSGTKVQLMPVVDLNQRYGVTLGSISVPSGRDTVSFDPRGLITGTTTAYKITITKGTSVDTVCVSGLGNTMARGC